LEHGAGGPLLRVEKLTKAFGGILALNRVSFELQEGEILGVMGPNGSGKTTLVNCITGFVKPNSGKVFFKGKEITGIPPHKIADMGIGRTFQIMRPYYSLPAYKNLVTPLFSHRAKRFAGGGKLGDRGTTAIDILEDVGFERDASVPYKPAGSLPLGYLKRLELGRCIALRSEMMLCDEVFSGLGATEIGSLVPLVERLNMSEGVTLLMIEHRLKELFQVSHRIIVMNFGEKIFEGKPKEALENPRVKEAYFGKGKEVLL
jgi:branched-chain amino acid transport system ATP-binding protein